jgi:uncharacterized protein
MAPPSTLMISSGQAEFLRDGERHGRGDRWAQAFLGFLFDTGMGVPQDYVTAHMWFNLAAATADTYAINRDEIAARMTPAQVAEAQLAREWKPR